MTDSSENKLGHNYLDYVKIHKWTILYSKYDGYHVLLK